jgi:HAE1 family hydrophobic/amphiphilic exporter-1
LLCARYLRGHDTGKKHGRLFPAFEGAFDASLLFYTRGLKWVLGHERLTLGFSLLVLAGTAGLFVVIPKGFLPSDDIGQIFAPTKAAQGISFESMVEHQKKLAAIVNRTSRASCRAPATVATTRAAATRARSS